MNKKVLLGVLSLSLLFTKIDSTTSLAAASNATNFSPYINAESIKSDVISKITLMDQYLEIVNDRLYLNPTSRLEVTESVYSTYEQGVLRINNLIDKNALKIDAKDNIVPVNYAPPTPSLGGISTNAFGNFYSWGYALTLTDQESKDLAFALTAGATSAGAITAVMGLIPTPPTKLAQAVSYIVGGAYGYIAAEISYKNNGRGVTLNFRYALSYEITSN
ncbi:hypothetical protein [Paenibacillus campi]|uniref:hypothetical protein n=1 Tax=Paenibacillus campi TaxID=3106031 RepID=UPI002AFFD786|nr:hypothetical protein [Paenibacillus sp. SGZ-1014]